MKKLLQFRLLMLIALANITILLVSMHGTWQDIKTIKNLQDQAMDSRKMVEAVSKASSNLHAENNLPWWETITCTCETPDNCVPTNSSLERLIPPKLPEELGSCSRRAAADGFHQRVISFSLYGNDPDYWIGLPDTIKKAKELYPGWKIWIYTNPRGRSKVLCPLLMKHNHVRVCDATNLPHPIYNLTDVHNMLWRAAPLGDPQVDALMVRDSDAMLTEREQSAVQEWLKSGKIFHLMRDHPFQNVLILGGMWGAQNWQRSQDTSGTYVDSTSPSFSIVKTLVKTPSAERLREIRDNIFRSGNKKNKRGKDQSILKDEMWEDVKNSVIVHDSYFCKRFPTEWHPFPTKRVDNIYVGNLWYRDEFRNKKYKLKCPKACRPPDHQDWIYC